MNIDPEKDYYGILGVTPKAELAVIKAAYKALASIYHPDKNSSKGAAEKMVAINEAWSVLSDPITRKKYDEIRTDIKQEDHIFGENEGQNDGKDVLEKDWDFAISYYPDLKELGERLAKISWRLSIAFKAHVLEEKTFKKRVKIAQKMENEFLTTYFGNNRRILNLAKELIFIDQNKKLLRELNTVVTTIGSSDPDPIIRRFKAMREMMEAPVTKMSFEQIRRGFEEKGYAIGVNFGGVYRITKPSGERIFIKDRDALDQFYKEMIE